MSDDKTYQTGSFEAEFRRQLRSGQLRRFVNELPAFTLDRETPERFAHLLARLDRASEIDPSEFPNRTSPKRHN